MRLDKYLQLSRIIRQRSLGKELCQYDRVFQGDTDDHPLKASHEVNVGDILTVIAYNRRLVVKILEVPATKNVSKQKAKDLYEVIKEESLEG